MFETFGETEQIKSQGNRQKIYARNNEIQILKTHRTNQMSN